MIAMTNANNYNNIIIIIEPSISTQDRGCKPEATSYSIWTWYMYNRKSRGRWEGGGWSTMIHKWCFSAKNLQLTHCTMFPKSCQ